MANNKKTCGKCGKNKAISAFYTNKEWALEQYRDSWCKNCIQSFVKSKDDLIDYCNANFRKFSEDLWDYALEHGERVCDNSDAYRKASIDRKEKLVLEKSIAGYFKQMNLQQHYRFTGDKSQKSSVQQSDDDEGDQEPDKNSKRIYSKIWQGSYTKDELEYLENYYESLERDYEIRTQNHRDYARKVAKASLMMDKVTNDMLSGRGSEKKYKETKEVFDSLSSSAKFSEKTRTPDTVTGLGSFGELVKRIEEGKWQPTQLKFKPDVIDQIRKEYRHTFKSLKGSYEDE